MHPPTDSQWTAVRETDRHLLVTAGAGTGKTHTVVWKVLYLLGVEVNGQSVAAPLRLRDIAAITYTNQAAKELKEALRRGLRAVGRRDDAFEVDLARIGTIHSFCAELLREYALRAGRPPFREVVEEGVGQERALEAARDTLVEALDRPERRIEGLDTLLAAHKSADVDRWVVELMQRADLARRLHADRSVGGWERVLLELATRALERYEAVLLRDGALDFDRMVIWTRDLLRDDAGIRGALQRRIRTLIVDEFQDVDPVQKEIAYLLGDPESGESGTTRLVLVGDPKQSIYRFRHADVSVWTAVEQDFTERGHGRVVALEDNFRSVPAVLSFVEHCIGPVLDAPLDGNALQPFEVPFRAVRPTRADAGEDPAVEFIVVPPDSMTGKPPAVAQVREAEAEAIARRLSQLHEAGTPWQDMALLMAGWTGLDIYRDALERHGIPAYALRGEGFFETREVLDLVLVLQAIRDPREDRALFGFLRSPFAGMRDESLAAIALAHRPPYFDRLDDVELPDAEEQERLQRARAWLEAWGRLRDRAPITALLRRVLDETGYLAHLALLGEEKAQAIANVRQFLSMVRAMGDVGVDELLRVVEEARARKDRTPEARLHAETDPVVTITSIHVAKGLEWPVVVWADASAGDRNYAEKLVVLSGAIALGRPDLTPKEQDPEWQALRGRYMVEEDAEAKRLWYVAATRARDRLIISGIAQPAPARKAPIADMLLARFPDLATAKDGEVVAYTGLDAVARRGRVIHTPRLAPPIAVVPETDYARVRVGAPASLTAPPPPVRVPVGPGRHSATSLLAHSRCGRRYWLKYVAGLREPEPFGTRDALITAVARGQIVHDVIERYEEERELDLLLEDAIGRWDEHAPPPDTDPGRRYRAELRGEVERVIEHPAWNERVARGARRELSFLHIAGPDAITQGAIDLAVATEDGGALELIDVKTTQCSVPEARRRAETYRPQREVYTAAATDIAGLPVIRFGFLYSRPGVNVEGELDGDDIDEARRRVRERIAHAALGDPEMTDDPNECRACGFRRVRLCPGVE